MSSILKIFLLTILFLQLILIIHTTKKRKFSIKYATMWILLIFGMAFVVIFPNILYTISSFFGFEVASNMIFLLAFFFLFYMIFILTASISIQNEKIKLLLQEISLLKESVDKDGKKE